MGDDHLSGARVTERLGAMWLVRTGRPYNRAILLQVGFTRARVTAQLRELLPHDFTLAWAPESPRGMFLWHFPSSCPDRTLSCTLPYEARTFLTPTTHVAESAVTQRTPRRQYTTAP